jgi:nucleoside 2-deoxyribosyltransferase
MILRGIIENTFGGPLCVRGFARIGDLAKISESKDYQRNLDPQRTKSILKFLKTGKYRFFPELILSLQIDSQESLSNLYQGVKSNLTDNIKFDLYKKDFIDYQSSDKFDSPLLKRISLDFIDEKKKVLSRIDGNHRLSAIDELLEEDKFIIKEIDYLVPYCIIIQVSGIESIKFDTACFHLINSKAKPLTTEENLKAILLFDQFSDDEIQDIVGLNSITVKKIYKKIVNNDLDGIKLITSNTVLSFCNTCVDLIYKLTQTNIDLGLLKGAILKSNQMILDLEFGNNQGNIGILIAFIYYEVTNKLQATFFLKWIKKNKLVLPDESFAESIIQIFNKIYLNKIKVFVAMPYFSQVIVESYNDIYQRAIFEINSLYSVDIEIYKIMTYEGSTLNIVQDIMNKIKECTIFIADITNNNPNVTYEMGWARALEKPTIILKEKDAEAPRSDYKMDYFDTYDKSAHLTLKEVVVKHLRAIITNEFGYTLEKSHANI